MSGIGERIQQADWKKEKHAPVIHCPDAVVAGQAFEIKVNIGEEIAHPNTTEHHISYITVFFHPEGEKFTYQVGHFEFSGHGEAVAGPNQGPVYTEPSMVAMMKLSKPGTLHAVSFCNIHGLWESEKEIKIAA
jgi:superoxide reductase